MNKVWVPWASGFATLNISLLLGFLTANGCDARCASNFDCGSGLGFCNLELGRCEVECYSDQDCRQPVECHSNPTACQPKGLSCNSVGRCVGQFVFRHEGPAPELPPPEVGLPSGWNDDPRSGHPFILDTIQVASDRGIEVDGLCEDGCGDNALASIGDFGNGYIATGIASGQTRLLLLLAGLPANYQGEADHMTLKIYSARDADNPPNVNNDFSSEVGPCCEFALSRTSLTSYNGIEQAAARAPVKIERGKLRSLAPALVPIVLTVGEPPYDRLDFEAAVFRARVPTDLASLREGRLGAALRGATLANTRNPYCRRVGECPVVFDPNSTLLDMVAAIIGPGPDIDLDGDGLECYLDSNGDRRIDLCCDGFRSTVPCGTTTRDCDGPVANAVNSDPASCVKSDRMQDGYSVTLNFSARAAKIVRTVE